LQLAVFEVPAQSSLVTGFNNLDMKVAIERDHVDALEHTLVISLMGSKQPPYEVVRRKENVVKNSLGSVQERMIACVELNMDTTRKRLDSHQPLFLCPFGQNTGHLPAMQCRW